MRNPTIAACVAVVLACATARGADVDVSGVRAGGAVEVKAVAGGVELAWNAGAAKASLLIAAGEGKGVKLNAILNGKPLFENASPSYTLRVGERDLKPSGWMVFFDKVDDRPFKSFPVAFKGDKVKVDSTGTRATVTITGATAGGFSGDLVLTLYSGTPLVQMEAVLSTAEDSRAITFEGGIEIPKANIKAVGHSDWDGAIEMETPADLDAKPIRARLRAVVAETANGSVTVFPPPHQFFYPTDFANNFGFNAAEVRGDNVFIGVRQPVHADGRFRPWVNAPPNTKQRISTFLSLSDGNTAKALDSIATWTHNDRVPEVPGYKTMISHMHLEHTAEFQRQQRESADPDGIPWSLIHPGWTQAFQAKGVNIVHLAEFHVGDTPRRDAKRRLSDLHTLHSEARRLSNDGFLVLPGEEPNVHLGGHWISLFPKPVYWVLNRAKNEPFEEKLPTGETLYRVGNAADVLQLMERENGLMWTAHPRIKASQGFPDAYMQSDYFKSDHYLGGAWKNMPADYSLDRLGTRVLNLEDDMANRGFKKNILGEIDLFEIEPNYELYGHVNVNYLKLDALPKFDAGWQPILDILRHGQYFTTTGEITLTNQSIGGKTPGETLPNSDATEKTPVKATFNFTFPPAFAEVISGDGQKTYRDHIDLSTFPAFATHDLDVRVNLKGRKWARLEVWDIAKNGAFTPTVWIGD